MKIHETSEVYSPQIGEGTRIWQFVVILYGAKIGKRCNICSHVFIENEVEMGNDVTVKNGARLYDGLIIGDGVFIGMNTVFCNDKYPRSGVRRSEAFTIRVGSNASIGANVTVLPGVTIGSGALIAAGSVVTKNVPPSTLVSGNPARIRRVTV